MPIYVWGFGIAMLGSGMALGSDYDTPENKIGLIVWVIGVGLMLYAM